MLHRTQWPHVRLSPRWCRHCIVYKQNFRWYNSTKTIVYELTRPVCQFPGMYIHVSCLLSHRTASSTVANHAKVYFDLERFFRTYRYILILGDIFTSRYSWTYFQRMKALRYRGEDVAWSEQKHNSEIFDSFTSLQLC